MRTRLWYITRRLNSITPPPWHVRHLDDDYAASLTAVATTPDTRRGERWPKFSASEMVCATIVQNPIRYIDIADGRWEANAHFIAHAPSDVRHLLNRVQAYSQLLAELRGRYSEAWTPEERESVDQALQTDSAYMSPSNEGTAGDGSGPNGCTYCELTTLPLGRGLVDLENNLLDDILIGRFGHFQEPAMDDAWNSAVEALPLESATVGEVVARTASGIYADLGVPFPGFLHLAQTALPRTHDSYRLLAPVGARIEVRILDHDELGRQIILTQLATADRPNWDGV